MKRVFFYFFLFLLLGLFLAFQLYLKPRLPVINGYAAHMACSCHFLANRKVENIIREDLHFSPLNLVTLRFDEEAQSASSSLFGFGKKTALYKEGLGCMLLKGTDDFKVKSLIPKVSPRDEDAFEIEALNLEGWDSDQLKMALDKAFDQVGTFTKKTRAVVVLHKGQLVAEQYAEGIDQQTPLLGWSMTKSIANALVGILIKEGVFNLDDEFKEKDWEKAVSLNDLLKMNSGIAWEEVYDQPTDATRMLFDSEFCAAEMIDNKTDFEPGTHWKYSSGTTNYISKIIKEALDDDAQYQALPYQNLAEKIGANSFVMEMDESGHFIMSSYGWATARDWAKFGQLFLNDGKWGDEQILPEGWVSYSRQVNTVSDDGCYGAHLWLNTNHNAMKSAPENAYYFSGFQGQKVLMIPSEDLIVVRLGVGDWPGFKMDDLVGDILNSKKQDI